MKPIRIRSLAGAAPLVRVAARVLAAVTPAADVAIKFLRLTECDAPVVGFVLRYVVRCCHGLPFLVLKKCHVGAWSVLKHYFEL